MTSEIRANTLKNRVGLGTVSFTNTGPVVSGIVTIANSTAEGVRLEDNAGVGGSLKITTPTGYVSIGAGNATFVHLNTDRGIFYFQRRITVDEGIISSYDENLILQSPVNTTRLTINKDTGLVSIVNDLDVDGHTNLDNVSIAGITTVNGGFIFDNGTNAGKDLQWQPSNNRLAFFNDVKATFGNTVDLQIYHDSTENHIYGSTSKPIIFSTNTGERLRITSTGVLNVPAGIGPQLRFENQHSVTTDAVISTFDDASGTLLCLGSNFYINSSGAETRYNTSEESTGIILNRQGYINLNTGGTGTNALNRIQITETGKVQIGLPGNAVSLPGGVEVVNIRAMDEGNLIVRAIGSLMSAPSGSGVGLDVLNNANNTVKDLCIRGAVVAFRSATAETLRMNANGDVTTTGQASFDRQNAGFTARSGDSVSITRASGTPLEINRTGSDGQMIGLLDDNSYEAAIGLSGGSLVFGLPNTSTPRLTITSGGHATINSNSYEALNINTNNNGVNGPEISLFHNSASPAVNDIIGQLRYTGRDSAGNITLYSKIETKLDNVTDGQETGFLDFSTRGLGSYSSVFRLKRRSTGSAPSYTADDMDGVILDIYNTGNPYPRYMNFIAKAAGNTDSNIAFWTETIGGSPLERLRIDSKGSMRHMGTSGYWQITVIHNGSGSGNWYSGSAPQQIYPNYIDNRTGYAEFIFEFHPSVSYSGYSEPTFVICGGDGGLKTGGTIELNTNRRTNSPSNGTFRSYHGQYSWQIYNDGDTDQVSGQREINRNVEHRSSSYIASSTQSVDYVPNNDGRYGTNVEPIIDQRSYIKIKMNGVGSHNAVQGHPFVCRFVTYSQGDKNWFAYMQYN